MKPYQKLIQHWTAEGLPVVSGASDEALRKFETNSGIALPGDFREYLQNTNGMAQLAGQDCDEKGFSFWPLRRIKTVRAECVEQGLEVPSSHEVEKYFVFADYMQWSWAYAIGVGSSQEGKILQFGTLLPRIIADSFSEFVESYLRDSEQIYSSMS